jgi:hypothetical protein
LVFVSTTNMETAHAIRIDEPSLHASGLGMQRTTDATTVERPGEMNLTTNGARGGTFPAVTLSG